MMPRTLSIAIEDFPLRVPFRIARGEKRGIRVVTVTLTQNGHSGQGEGVPYARYGETPESVAGQIEAIRPILENAQTDRLRLLDLLPAGAARNAVDCALWALESAQTGRPLWDLAGLPRPVQSLPTVQTLSLDTPGRMAEQAQTLTDISCFKIKLGAGEEDLDRLKAIRSVRPDARFVVDVNEGWTIEQLRNYSPSLQSLGVEMLEQPLPVGQDEDLLTYESPLTLCADEGSHTAEDLPALKGKYGMVNLKLDKTGGLTHALEMKRKARAAGFQIMVGCMVCTSLSILPAMILAHDADLSDLDGPTWLAQDRERHVSFDQGHVFWPDSVSG